MSRPPTCRFYQAGACFNGDECPFSHPTQRCRSFTSDGWCPYGHNCYYWHDPDYTAINTPDGRPVQKVCRFFLNGQCMYGDTCAFSHQFDDSDDECGNQVTLATYRLRQKLQQPKPNLFIPLGAHLNPPRPVENTHRPAVSRPSVRLEHAYINALQPGDLEKMRELEVDKLLKRFPPSQLKQVPGCGRTKSFALLFSSTDPDWSHKFKQIMINISLRDDYPASPPILNVQRTTALPIRVTNTLNEAICKWIDERQRSHLSTNKVALFLRPLLFWLDKTLDSLVTKGYNSAAENDQTIEDDEEDLVSLPDNFLSSDGEGSTCDRLSEDSKTSLPQTRKEQNPEADKAVNPEGVSDHEQTSSEDGQAENNVADSSSLRNVSTNKQQVSLEGFELRGQAGTCVFIRLPVFCACSRCKYTFQWVFRLPSQRGEMPQLFSSTPPHTSTCPRCRQPLGLSFEASVVHGFSSVIGAFELANCILSDVPIRAADAIIHCINCNSNMKMTGLHPDRVTAKRCHKCNLPCGIFFSGTAIHRQKETSSEISKRFASLAVDPSSKPSKDRRKKSAAVSNVPFVIQKGTPLPNNGSCRHYRRSFRWLRFPCCDRTFPCDVCHDEEVAGTHEILQAKRMICGFCSKEQATGASQNVCIVCLKNLTGSHSNHWEGGQGCRNQAKMSRKDNRKYSRLNK